MKKRIALLAAAVLALTACSSSAGTEVDMKNIDAYTPAQTAEEEELSFVTEGETAPDIPIIKLDGTEAKVSDYFDKPTLFVFWATWLQQLRGRDARSADAGGQIRRRYKYPCPERF